MRTERLIRAAAVVLTLKWHKVYESGTGFWRKKQPPDYFLSLTVNLFNRFLNNF